jgi:hypothetical protein
MSDQLPPYPPPVSFSVPAAAPAGDKKGLAVASLILGILSLCAAFVPICGALVPIVGLVLGFLGMKSSRKGLAIAGIILSAIGLLLTIIFVIVVAANWPAIQEWMQNQVMYNIGY